MPRSLSLPFEYQANPMRVHFGQGTINHLPLELDKLGIGRALIVSTADQADAANRVGQLAGGRSVGVFAGAVMHTPVDVTREAMAMVEASCVDGIISIGGGSTIGLGKAVAIRTGLPQLVIPTTYAGSEMTPILGETSAGEKVTRSDLRILPRTVIYDVELTLTLPPKASGTSGLNAMAHAVEALYARNGNPIISLMAAEGIGALAAALPGIVANPPNADARAQALYGAWLCGACLGAVGMSLHHKLCHVLGGSFGLPHAETHSIILPHALAYNAPAVPEAMQRLTDILGPDPAQALFDLRETVGAPAALRDIGMPESGIDQAVATALASPYWNPRALDAGGIGRLIRRAWQGLPPQQE